VLSGRVRPLDNHNVRLNSDVKNISAEGIQAAGNGGVEMMYQFCSNVWEEETFPQMWKKSIIYE